MVNGSSEANHVSKCEYVAQFFGLTINTTQNLPRKGLVYTVTYTDK